MRGSRCKPTAVIVVADFGTMASALVASAARRVGKGASRRAHQFDPRPEWWARGACHRARIRATRWLCPPYALSGDDRVFQRRSCTTERPLGYWVPRLKRGMTVEETSDRVLAARDARVFCFTPPSSHEEGAGNAGCSLHPWSACNQKARGRTTGSAETTGIPCAMVLRLIRDLLGEPGLFATVTRKTRYASLRI